MQQLWTRSGGCWGTRSSPRHGDGGEPVAVFSGGSLLFGATAPGGSPGGRTLRHAQQRTTALYAKLDQARLAELAVPCPQGTAR